MVCGIMGLIHCAFFPFSLFFLFALLVIPNEIKLVHTENDNATTVWKRLQSKTTKTCSIVIVKVVFFGGIK